MVLMVSNGPSPGQRGHHLKVLLSRFAQVPPPGRSAVPSRKPLKPVVDVRTVPKAAQSILPRGTFRRRLTHTAVQARARRQGIVTFRSSTTVSGKIEPLQSWVNQCSNGTAPSSSLPQTQSRRDLVRPKAQASNPTGKLLRN